MNSGYFLFFLEGKQVPSSRFRVLQFQDHIKNQGDTFKNLYTWPSKYLVPAPKFGVWLWIVFGTSLIVLTRFFQIVLYSRKAKVIILQRDLLFRVNIPFLERFLFWWIRRRRADGDVRVVFDVDDAIFLDKLGRQSKGLKTKIEYIATHSDLIVTGNQYLKDFFSPLKQTVVIPTTVDCEKYIPRSAKSSAPLVIGWMGTATNLNYLREIELALISLQQRFEFKVLIVTGKGGSKPFSEAVKNVSMREWSEQTELQDLQSMDIGIMPLPNDAWAQGKCGFKLLQYMACGMPAVASRVGVNSDIIKHGENGFLVDQGTSWEIELARFLENPALIPSFGERARKAIICGFDTKTWAPKWSHNLIGLKNA